MSPKISFVAALLFGMVVSESAAERSAMVKFKISGGKTVECPVTDGGPLPAEGGPYRMDVAALITDRINRQNVVKFAFGVTLKTPVELTRVRVEDVSEAAATPLVDDKEPQISKRQWSGSAKPIPLSPRTTPWIFNKKATIKVFRVTISAKNREDIILHQPAWYSAPAKKQLVKLLKKSG